MPAASRTFRGFANEAAKHELTAKSGRRPASSRQILKHLVVSVETHQALEFVDITLLLCDAVRSAGLGEGLVTVWTRHTTMGLLVNESEPLLLRDLVALFERLAPAGAHYEHDDFKQRTVNVSASERRNGHAHCRAALLRTSETIPVRKGRIELGRWQRVFLVEFDGGQRRELRLILLGHS